MELLDIEQEASKNSIIHKIDGRAKIISFLLVVLFAVFIGRSGESTFIHRMQGLGILELYLLAILLTAELNKSLFLKRVLLILPFGGAIILLKPFIEEGNPIFTLPLGVTITYEGTIESVLLLSVMIVTISSIVLLSSTTTVQALVDSLRKIGAPKEFALLFGMTLRYLFLYFDTFQKMAEAQKSRCFSIRNKRVKPKFILEQLGYTVAMLFIRSHKQGINVHQSMLSRCYNSDSTFKLNKNKITPMDVSFPLLTILAIGIAIIL